MGRMSRTVVALSVAALLCAMVAEAQREVAHEVVNGVLAGVAPGVGARAAGMGDAHVAVATDATAFYWNPAGLAYGGGVEWALPTLRYRSNGLGIGDLADMLSIAHADADLGAAEFALMERLEGENVRLGGSALTAYRNGNWAIGAYAQGMAEFVLQDIGAQRMWIFGYGLDAASYGAAYGDTLDNGLAWGVQAGWLKAGMGRTNGYLRDEGDGTFTPSLHHRTNHATDWNVNVGLMYEPAERVRVGLVGRNINSPTLRFWDDNIVDYDPSVHLGVATWSADGRTLFAADLHNVFSSNGEGDELCLGVERQVRSGVALRAGLKDGDLTFGAGITAGGWDFAIATGLPLDEELTISASSEF